MKKTLLCWLAACGAAAVIPACGDAAGSKTLSGLERERFHSEVNGRPTDLYTLTNAAGMEVCITNFGGRIVSVMVPDRAGTLRDVVLGFDNIDDYRNVPSDFGAAIGRYANRIGHGRFVLDGDTVRLPVNNYGHCLHGGPDGWQYRIYEAQQLDRQSLSLTLHSPHGDAGFPGAVTAKVVYRLTDDLAMVQTLDFFPPVVEDPYTFGKIAAANALSDIYAMGGEVRTALNIVCFPEQMDLNVLGEIMRGGAEKVQEAGGSLSGGHSIADDSVKYGLSVTGTVHPDRIWQNNTGRVGDLLILTKPLGTGILCAAHRVGEENPGGFQKAVESMMTLNKYASETARKYNIHACTDVTGFSFLGHLHEMMESGVSCHIWADQIPVFPGAVEAAEEFLITAAGQRNRNHLEQHVTFKDIPFGMQEVLFDPQTSGGLLMAVDAVDAEKMQRKLLEQGIPAAIVGKITEPAGTEIYVTQSKKW